MSNVDESEIAKFTRLAAKWWDPNSEFKPLHDINPLRLNHIKELFSLQGKKILDVGCGGGILAESMAAEGGLVTGIDLAETPLKVAKMHLSESGLNVNYRAISAENLAEEMPNSFDVITCMEMLEHVPVPSQTVEACAKLLKPDGWLIFSTINRNPKSYLFAIIGAEYVLNLLPKGTHDYEKLIRPSELAQFCRDSNLAVHSLKGMSYNPILKKYSLNNNTSVNYFLIARPAL